MPGAAAVRRRWGFLATETTIRLRIAATIAGSATMVSWRRALFAELGEFCPRSGRPRTIATFQLCGLNSRFRFCRYRHGRAFASIRTGALRGR